MSMSLSGSEEYKKVRDMEARELFRSSQNTLFQEERMEVQSASLHLNQALTLTLPCSEREERSWCSPAVSLLNCLLSGCEGKARGDAKAAGSKHRASEQEESGDD